MDDFVVDRFGLAITIRLLFSGPDFTSVLPSSFSGASGMSYASFIIELEHIHSTQHISGNTNNILHETDVCNTGLFAD